VCVWGVTFLSRTEQNINVINLYLYVYIVIYHTQKHIDTRPHYIH